MIVYTEDSIFFEDTTKLSFNEKHKTKECIIPEKYER